MPITLRVQTARILCLLMAIYLLNFSVDYPAGNRPAALVGESVAHQPVPIENLLAMALDVSITLEKGFPEKAAMEGEAEPEVIDVLEFLSPSSLLSCSSTHLYLHKQLLDVPASDLNTLYPEVNYLPPKNTLSSVVA